MIVAVLCAAAIAVLWWPQSRAEYRLLGMRPSRSAGSSRAAAARSRYGIVLVIIAVAASFGAEVAGSVAMIVAVVLWRDARRRRASAARLDDESLLVALSIMIAEMSVGSLAATACTAAAAELSRTSPDSAVAQGLASLAGRAAMGGQIRVADLTATRAGIPDASWQRIGAAWQLSDRHGLPMADLLVALRSDVLAHNAFDSRTKAGLAGPRATATVLAGLPVLGIALGQATGANPVGVLAGGGLGGILLLVGTALVVAGLCWSDRIVERVGAR